MSEKPLPRYRCHKEVSAFQIRDLTRINGAVELAGQGCVATVSEAWLDKHSPGKGIETMAAMLGGYYVRYDDGYESFSPAEAFEAGYSQIA